MSKKKKEEKEREEAALLEVAKRSERQVVRRGGLNAPSSNNVSTNSKNSKRAAPVVTTPTAAAKKSKVKKSKAAANSKEKSTAKKLKKLVESKKRKHADDSEESSPEPVVTGLRQRTPQQLQADPRKGLTAKNAKKNKNTDVAEGTKLQIRYGRNKGTLYNATVTEVLDDEHVKVCTKDKDPDIAETKFKIVRLTEEQAKSGRPCGFTSKKANVGFPVEGAHDS